MRPRLVERIADMRSAAATLRQDGPLGLVPTMGALHDGHASLMARARRDCAGVVVSIFVNPLQFDRPEDLERYPVQLGADLDACRRLEVDVVFAPPVDEMYPRELACTVEVGAPAAHLCGRHRPGHFRGVATVVLKLLQIVQPEVAFFGEKDAQQLAVVRRMVQDLDVPVRIVGVPTVRDRDGLAISSRNRHLDAGERRLAPALYAALRHAQALVEGGATDARDVVERAASTLPRDRRLNLEYLELVDPDRFEPVGVVDGPVVAAGALWVGATRLIDNVRCEPRGAA